ncbi:Uncharacterised protein [Vibrio cholerae]|nr:Uncharacterised protein [Vibrio cholerae]
MRCQTVRNLQTCGIVSGTVDFVAGRQTLHRFLHTISSTI